MLDGPAVCGTVSVAGSGVCGMVTGACGNVGVCDGITPAKTCAAVNLLLRAIVSREISLRASAQDRPMCRGRTQWRHVRT